MLIRHVDEIEPIAFGNGAQKRVAIGPKQGAPAFVMRLIDLAPGTTSPQHSHDWEHEGLILSGSGSVIGVDEARDMKKGDAFFIPANEEHYMSNNGDEPLSFVCVVPTRGEDTP